MLNEGIIINIVCQNVRTACLLLIATMMIDKSLRIQALDHGQRVQGVYFFITLCGQIMIVAQRVPIKWLIQNCFYDILQHWVKRINSNIFKYLHYHTGKNMYQHLYETK